ncbi:secreted RxLR effector protein 161-like [Manihot esculenta]|uniref:secreted RxLR effector protein 161-like n=1 Tax=Manihot esculenta TaxID=3983 RepID=UPI001CC4BCC9|nr:secreted RxLR effector protein 161-like [Manihot esculenta]
MDSRTKLSKKDESPLVNATLYKSTIRSLGYLVSTRPDLAYSVGIVSRFMESLTSKHLGAVKQILRYIKGILNYGCRYVKEERKELRLIGYCDSDLAGDIDDRKSTSGVIYFLGSNPITWFSQKQKVVALSSCEAEYVAATAGACQGVWIERFLSELRGQQDKKTLLRIDNRSAIALTKNRVHHSRSKHIDVKYHFLRDCVQNGDIEVEYVKTEEQCADILTKPLSWDKFEKRRIMIGIKNVKTLRQD